MATRGDSIEAAAVGESRRSKKHDRPPQNNEKKKNKEKKRKSKRGGSTRDHYQKSRGDKIPSSHEMSAPDIIKNLQTSEQKYRESERRSLQDSHLKIPPSKTNTLTISTSNCFNRFPSAASSYGSNLNFVPSPRKTFLIQCRELETLFPPPALKPVDTHLSPVGPTCNMLLWDGTPLCPNVEGHQSFKSVPNFESPIKQNLPCQSQWLSPLAEQYRISDRSSPNKRIRSKRRRGCCSNPEGAHHLKTEMDIREGIIDEAKREQEMREQLEFPDMMKRIVNGSPLTKKATRGVMKEFPVTLRVYDLTDGRYES